MTNGLKERTIPLVTPIINNCNRKTLLPFPHTIPKSHEIVLRLKILFKNLFFFYFNSIHNLIILLFLFTSDSIKTFSFESIYI